ncbi:MAG: DUF924 domain-containing protein [Candidatus Thiodiazotropha sp. (ex Monitilora ramsayi)]|nr:DUF924 domain-containing protein [Candidatus Thiodiazotropha sp. (ex Monitilora ramsayi)]
MSLDIKPRAVLEFWFSARVQRHWFDSTPKLDDEIRERFERLWISAGDGELSDWQKSAKGALALVVVLDQFPLNMFRNQPAAFQTEQQAVSVTRQAITDGLDDVLVGNRLAFLYMPLMHSESMADQDLSVRLFETAGLRESAKFARHHREIVKRFGRFPHRNAILGRDSTPDEIAYLVSTEAFKG